MKRIKSLDVLGEVRRAMRILRRVEHYLTAQERAAKKSGTKAAARFEEARERSRKLDEEYGGQP